MNAEGLLDIMRKTRYYRKPFMQRNELSREISRAIVKEDMDNKIRFLMRKNRMDAFPGQMTTWFDLEFIIVYSTFIKIHFCEKLDVVKLLFVKEFKMFFFF